MRCVFRTSKKVLASLTAAATLLCGLQAAQAQVAGCDPRVLNAMKAKAQAQVAYDIAVTNEMIEKPQSVLDLTCFAQAAGVSANVGGSIFSDPFTAPLSTLMPVAGGGGFACTAMQDLWTVISQKGINQKVPYAYFSDLMLDAPPAGAGPDYTKSWSDAAAVGVFSGLSAAVTALPPPKIIDYSTAKSSCDVLVAAGIAGSCP